MATDEKGAKIIPFPIGRSIRRKDALRLFMKGVAAEEEGRKKMAYIFYNEAILLDSILYRAWLNKGTLEYLGSRFDDALKSYLQATGDPTYETAFYSTGRCFESMKNWTRAIEYYTKALLINPWYADVHFNLSFTYKEIGETQKRFNHLQLYLQCEVTDDSWRAAAEKELASIKKESLIHIVRVTNP